MPARAIEFTTVGVPDLAAAETIPTIPAEVYEARTAALLARTDADWVVVYGDAEHPANLVRLTGFDPRFEEALLVLGRGRRTLVVGSEGMGHARGAVVPADLVEVPTFSLPWIRRDQGRATLREGLSQAGIGTGDRVALVGWKPIEDGEWAEGGPALAVPSFVTDTLRGLVGATGAVLDATQVVMRADGGLRYAHDADQIAFFEWGGSRSSLCTSRTMAAARPGVSEPEAMGAAGYRGEQTLYRPILTSGEYAPQGLKSPISRTLELGDPIFTTWGFWGGNCGRGGMVAADTADLRPTMRGYLEDVAIPYFRVMVAWYERLRLGAVGGDLHRATLEDCAANGFAPLLNTSHLQDWEDWPTTIFHGADRTPVTSGMNIAADVFSALNGADSMCHLEDTVAVADEALRDELAQRHPDVWARIQARRAFMRDRLGIDLAEEVLPYSVVPAYLAPFWMAPDLAMRAV